MANKFLSRTNLNLAIDGQLGLIDDSQIMKEISVEQKQDYESKFQEFYENDLKTGFYIHNDQDEEDQKKEDNAQGEDNQQNKVTMEHVQFFNYNLKNQWWYADKKNGNKIVIFSSEGKVNQDLSKDKDFFKLYQQSDITNLLNNFYKKYNYVLTMIYTKKENIKTLQQIQSKIINSSKSQVSSIINHFDRFQEEKEDFIRISIFISSLNFLFKHQDQGEFNNATTFEELKNILHGLKNDENLLIIPLVVKEEIKDVVQEDFEEGIDERILNYCELYRYECLYDSETGDESSEDEDFPVDDSSDEDEEDEEEEEDEDEEEEDKNPQQYQEKENQTK